jgi:hypothetical protein
LNDANRGTPGVGLQDLVNYVDVGITLLIAHWNRDGDEI